MLSGPCRKDVRSILGNLYLVQVLWQVFLGHAVQAYNRSGGGLVYAVDPAPGPGVETAFLWH